MKVKIFFIKISGLLYRNLLKPVLFTRDPEQVHNRFTAFGEALSKSRGLRSLLQSLWRVNDPALSQVIHGIGFDNPIGLSAGFDYEARLTGILPAIGFGFGTVGTITDQPYGGNPKPMLGRLIKSRSLMVNKGFKNLGMAQTLKNLSGKQFQIPIGASIGKTNGQQSMMTQEEAVGDIVAAFEAVESSAVPFSYYELNISCPNLFGSVEFYSSAHLRDLLAAVTGLKLSKPLFIKMPIDKSDEETRDMLDVIVAFPVQAVIFGNLQKNRQDPALDQEEVKKWPMGNFSGKPTEQRSNELIALAYKDYGSKLTIVGCGGVFSAEDAYRKIRLGASLVQLITGLIYVGPQLPGQINAGLLELMEQDGFTHISQAVGVDSR